MGDSMKWVNKSGNYNRIFNNETYIKHLYTLVRNKLGRQLISTEKMYIVNTIRNVDPTIFNNKSPSDVTNAIVNQLALDISTHQNDNEIINIQEMLKIEIGVSTDPTPDKISGDASALTSASSVNVLAATSTGNKVEVSALLGSTSINDFKSILNPSIKKTIMLYLDTRYRILDDNAQYSFKWNVTNNNSTTQGSVNYIGDVNNITSIKISPLRIPYISSADTSYNKLTMLINEFSAQSYIAQENAKFHFIFDILKTSEKYIDISAEDNNRGTYRFNNPITRLETLTVSFGSPLQPVIFDVDRRNMFVSAYAPDSMSFSSPYPHSMRTGDLVYISTYTTINPFSDNNIISAINNNNGIVIKYIDENTFSVPVNGSLIQGVKIGTVSVVKGSNQITGLGTTFFATFDVNDGFAVGSVTYIVASIISDTSLVLATPYTGDSLSPAQYQKNNEIASLQFSVYFGSKRMFIPLEIEYE